VDDVATRNALPAGNKHVDLPRFMSVNVVFFVDMPSYRMLPVGRKI
jgi:hypothetical protein